MDLPNISTTSAQVAVEHNYSTFQFKPLFQQKLEKSLSVSCLAKETENLLQCEESSDDDLTIEEKAFLTSYKPIGKNIDRSKGDRVKNGVLTNASERKSIRSSVYCTSHLKYKRKWLRDLLLSDSSSSDEEPDMISEERVKEMLSEHVKLKMYKQSYQSVTDKSEYQDYSMGILGQGPIESVTVHEKKQKGRPSGQTQHKKSSFPTSKKSGANTIKISKKKLNSPSSKKSSIKHTSEKSSSDKNTHNEDDIEDGEIVLPYGYSDLESFYGQPSPTTSKTGPSTPSGKDREKDRDGSTKDKKSKKDKKPGQEAVGAKRKRLWHNLVKKDIPKAAKMRQQLKKEKMTNAKKCAIAIMKQKRKEALSTQKTMTALQVRMRRVCKEVIIYWKRFERVEKQHLKKVQREAQEQRKADMNALENKRQTRKLNFLITQTELYAHFMAKKITGAGDEDKKTILERLNDDKIDQSNRAPHLKNSVHDDYDVNHVKKTIVHNVQDAYRIQTSRTAKFDSSVHMSADSNLGLSQPETASNEHPQPSILQGTLKSYQIKGMNWLANLYTQGINGILADEMGLGKTVQSIAFLAHLAEVHGIWGPFLVIAPASTLHNWEQECSKFIPIMKVVPYWGTTEMRKTLRKFWDQTHAHTQKASFHIVITSYQLVIQDAKFFQKINWIYMVLDEAQALKSSASTRWRTLLGFNCRNRLLLTGTPIQNSMAELWALLHFIMPTLFDSHDEFKEWFSKDIENSVEKQTSVDQSHLSRLHMILKPFMLRRIKQDVENDLANKIEILVYCPLTIRQRYLYDAIKRKIRIEDLLQSAAGLTSNYSTSSSTSSLMNLVMQFRKVCNHPELFERRDIKLPAHTPLEPYTIPKLIWRDGLISTCLPSRQHILYNMFYIHNQYTSYKLTRESTKQKGVGVSNVYSWLTFTRLTSCDMYRSMFCGLLDLLKLAALLYKLRQIHNHLYTYNHYKQSKRRESLLFLNHSLSDDRDNSTVLKDLLFTSYTSHAISHITHNHYYMRETQAHRKMRLRHMNGLVPSSPVKKRPSKALSVPADVQILADEDSIDLSTPDVEMRELGSYHIETTRLMSANELQLTDLPQFLLHNIHKAFSASLQWYVYDRSAEYMRLSSQYLSSRELYDTLRYGFTTRPVTTNSWRSEQPGGLEAVRPYYGFSQIYIPDKRSMIVDAGKMHVLDELLSKLKRDGHRVLIYSTMTKVIDLLEEFMWFRKHMYMRLDGSSKISDRRDMVSEFQNRSDVFVFLLSTRAGGLGINLTAADTVIFYDSDWNPTVDAQAMDRAHRLGQTKQVTVYRLVCKGTIEERILERAREKSEIQRMVISGQNQFKPDVLKPKEVVSLLIDDDTIKHRLQKAQEEKMVKVEKRKMERTAKKEASSKKPRVVKKSEVKENNVTSNAGSRESPAASENLCDDQSVNIDVMGDDSVDGDSFLEAASSRASTPSVSSAPSTPSVTQSAKKQRSRPKTSNTSKTRTPKQTSNLKKALNAAEIAGARAGITAAYAQYGYNPTNSQSKSK